MACLVAPLTVAVVMTAAKKRVHPKYHLNWLLAMLWGGGIWLMLEHIYHGEVILYPPFFTAGLREVVAEIFAVGVPQVAVTVAVWGAFVALSSSITKRRFQPNLIGLMFFGAVIMTFVDLLLA